MQNVRTNPNSESSIPGLLLRAVVDADLPIFVSNQQDAAAVHMAAFTVKAQSDRAAFDADWARIRSDSQIVIRTITIDGDAVGYVAWFVRDGKREVSYWTARAHWGRGMTTQALMQFLREQPQRPIHAAAAADNVASRRVLQKCGFVETGRRRGFAQARGAEIEEVLLILPA